MICLAVTVSRVRGAALAMPLLFFTLLHHGRGSGGLKEIFMNTKNEDDNFFSIDVSSLSHQNLVNIIKQLEGSDYVMVRMKAQKELVKRLKKEGFDNKGIAIILTNNVYGIRKRLAIAKEWAEALEISKDEFMKLIGK